MEDFSYISAYTLNAFMSELASRKDEFIFEVFNQCGYSKQEVLTLLYFKRIKGETYECPHMSNKITTIYVDDRPLFKLLEYVDYVNKRIEFDVEYL